MKKICTLLFMVLSVFALNAQTVNYLFGGPGDANSEFAGGLNDWITVGVSSDVPDSAQNAVWVWTPDGRLNTGRFWGDAGTIFSPSVTNGAAGFNSDFLDNGGADFGTGAAPSPHRGELISPMFDCTGVNDVILKFNHSARNFRSTFLVEVTNGSDSTIYNINDEIPVNKSQIDDVVVLDIS
ncbi:MAG: hypothetical protein AAFO94_11240, partial [Bacteroidota bacterium]